MPGGFWNNNTRPFRRRQRSLLGRKNHSENDLQEQDDDDNHWQNLPSARPQVTELVLPDNVRTILIAGTPECWNLSTSQSPYKPPSAAASNCDSSLVSLTSELSPTSYHGAPTIIDEDEPYDEPLEQSSIGGGLDWLRPQKQPKTTRRSSSSIDNKTRTHPKQQRDESKPSHMIVMYRSPPQTTAPPEQQALQVWCKTYLLMSVDCVLVL